MYELEICDDCGDLKSDDGICFSCIPAYLKDETPFVWEYAHESLTELGNTKFKRILPER